MLHRPDYIGDVIVKLITGSIKAKTKGTSLLLASLLFVGPLGMAKGDDLVGIFSREVHDR